MKKTKLCLMLVTVLMLAMLLTSCGGTVSSVEKFLNADYDISSDVLDDFSAATELTGYALVQFNDEFAIFSKGSEEAITYKIASMRTGTVVQTIAEAKTVCTFTLSNSAPIAFVTKVKTVESKIETTYLLYDATGALVASSEICNVAPTMFADLVVYNYVAYSVDEDTGALTEKMSIPEYVVLADCNYWNDDYYYVETARRLTVYDQSLNVVSTWIAPSYASGILTFLLNDGNVLIQYTYELNSAEKKFDFYENTVEGNTEKFDLVSLLFDAKKGETKELELDYYVSMVMTNQDLYDAEDDNNRFTDSFDNIAVILPIVDQKLDYSSANADLVFMNNKAKAGKSLQMVDNQGTNIPEKIGADLYKLQTLSCIVIMNGKGDVIKALNTDATLDQVGTYFVGERALYDLKLEEVCNFEKDKAKVIHTMDNTVFVQFETDDGYRIDTYTDGESKNIYTHKNGTPDEFIFNVVTGADLYVLVKVVNNEHCYYNAEGKLIATVSYELIVAASSAEHGTVLCTSVGDAGVFSYYFITE